MDLRTFYVFKVKKHFAILLKNNPYNLYKTMEKLYALKKDELPKKIYIFDDLVANFDKDIINNWIYDDYKEKDNYVCFKETHMINDYYTKEKSKLIVNNNYLLMISTKEVPIFFEELKKMDGNLFVCDFKNKDYFWLSSLQVSAC